MLNTDSAACRKEQGDGHRSQAETWDEVLAAVEQARITSDEVDVRYDAAYENYQQLAPSLEMLTPFFRFFPYQHRDYIAHSMDLDKARADFIEAEGRTRWAANEQARRAEMETALTAIATWRGLKEAAARVTGVNELAEESDASGEALSAAENRMILTPAPSDASLLLKLRRLFGQRTPGGAFEPSTCDAWIEAVLADAERLLEQEVAR